MSEVSIKDAIIRALRALAEEARLFPTQSAQVANDMLEIANTIADMPHDQRFLTYNRVAVESARRVSMLTMAMDSKGE